MQLSHNTKRLPHKQRTMLNIYNGKVRFQTPGDSEEMVPLLNLDEMRDKAVGFVAPQNPNGRFHSQRNLIGGSKEQPSGRASAGILNFSSFKPG